MRTLFIADLHLSETSPQLTRAFFTFLEQENTDVDALYILGDLFEVWIGDDEHTPLMDEVAQKLSQYHQRFNIPIYYIHGNRDFMIGKRYAKQSCMQLLPEHYEIDLYAQRVLIMHGDTLCLADKNYQRLRKIIHNPLLQFIFNCLPLKLRKKIGWKIRTASQSKKAYKKGNVMGVTESEVQRLLNVHQCTLLIHGHTHQVGSYSVLGEGDNKCRMDVGDWFNEYSFIEATASSTQIIFRPVLPI
ncbi:UDP-2,3-diacylglucosamine hydrolase [Psychromonas sp. CNPT3]|uniref:UDP-2,3-diacylglucosamine diphosphatase n=1 Tax=Psychromonas sp. CNPT3 TaxID=314282 RepID=UPI00006E4826|nr:UDP-2,3-diacylglucosamine diphosphatase [Psychromonas sp. CNPT3]AGH81251.1 UDP-2,3-diacylglucosamine hydrolase [Psychromonas sp. CNPT3]